MFLLIGRYARGIAAALAVVGLAAAAGAQANRPLAISDLITAVRVGGHSVLWSKGEFSIA